MNEGDEHFFHRRCFEGALESNSVLQEVRLVPWLSLSTRFDGPQYVDELSFWEAE
jgi:hypothetical protein